MQPERDMVIHNPAHRQLVGTLCMQLYHCMQVPVSVVQNLEVVHYSGAMIVLYIIDFSWYM